MLEQLVARFTKALTRSISWNCQPLNASNSHRWNLGMEDHRKRGFCQCPWFYSPRLNLKLVQVGTKLYLNRCHKPWQTKESFYRFPYCPRRNSEGGGRLLHVLSQIRWRQASHTTQHTLIVGCPFTFRTMSKSSEPIEVCFTRIGQWCAF